MTIKHFGGVIDGVCQQSPDAGLISNRHRSANSVSQHAQTKGELRPLRNPANDE